MIVVTYNRKKEVGECLASLEGLNYPNYEIVALDNGSTDNTGKEIKEKFPQVRLIRSEENLGGAGGRNLGIKHARGDYLLFIDDDAIADKYLLKELLTVIQSDAKIGIVQPKIYDYFERKKILGIGHDINRRTGRVLALGWGETDDGQYEEMREIPMVGCCWLVRKEVFQRAGTYDEIFFIPYEDSDFSIRVRKAGYKILYVPKAKIWHKTRKSHQVPLRIQNLGIVAPQNAYYICRNRIIFLKKHAPRADFIIFLLFLLPLYCLYHSLTILSCRRFDLLKNYWRGVASGLFLSLRKVE